MPFGLDFVADLYEAVLDPRGLSVFADFVAASLSAPSAVLHEIDGRGPRAYTSSAIAAGALEAYEAHYHHVNPLLPAALERIAPGQTACIGDLLPEADYFDSEFYCDFARQAGTAWVLGLSIEPGPGRLLAMAAHRPSDARDFGPGDRARLRRLAAVAAGAMRLRSRLAESRGAGLEALNALAFGAVVCDGHGRVVLANPAAEALAREGCGLVLAARFGGVSAALPTEAARLSALVRAAADGGEAGAMALTGPAGERTAVLVTPLPRRFGQSPALALLTFGADGGVPLADAATLTALYGLTPAEAAVAVAVSTGASVAEIAARLQVGEATVRTHVRRCLAKSGASSQRDFTARLARLPLLAPKP